MILLFNWTKSPMFTRIYKQNTIRQGFITAFFGFSWDIVEGGMRAIGMSLPAHSSRRRFDNLSRYIVCNAYNVLAAMKGQQHSPA